MDVLRFLSFPVAVIGSVIFWLWLDGAMRWKGVRVPWLGMALVALGGWLAGWCTLLFATRGQGSPHPLVAKTKHLVSSGPYAVVRNPMMWGVGGILSGIAFWLGSVGLWFGFALFLVFISFFVPGYEERDMERRFGEEYREYCRRVPRWWPRMGR